MFSGIVKGRGEVLAVTAGRLRLRGDLAIAALRPGDSVAVNGVCLTAATVRDTELVADVMPETLQRTTLGALRPGDSVNLERALTLADTVGGHLLTGHVDAVGDVVTVTHDGNAKRVSVRVPSGLMRLVAPQGSVAVDGISLTVVTVDGDAFTVSLIPHTLAVTNAGSWREGTRVNVEADIIARYVQRLLQASQQRALAEV
ncbi:MAG: riboflavin synthase [Candidatus Dormibacteraeota bacterium]|nr:riboflavin synthase [Candidatus Dormibacteraeota bacterium]